MIILGTICCRGGSKGIPGKNLYPLAGIPLISHTIRMAKNSAFLDEIIVSTDSEQIAKVAREEGICVPFLRPANLSSDIANKWDVFKHAVENWESLTGKVVELLVDMDVTVPLKTTGDIDGAIQFANDHPEADVVITAYESERNPYFNMMEIGNNGFASVVKKLNKPIVRRQDAPMVYSLTPATYVMKRAALYRFDHWSQAKCLIYPIPRDRAIDIDTEFDLKLIEYILSMKHAEE